MKLPQAPVPTESYVHLWMRICCMWDYSGVFTVITSIISALKNMPVLLFWYSDRVPGYLSQKWKWLMSWVYSAMPKCVSFQLFLTTFWGRVSTLSSHAKAGCMRPLVKAELQHQTSLSSIYELNVIAWPPAPYLPSHKQATSILGASSFRYKTVLSTVQNAEE